MATRKQEVRKEENLPAKTGVTGAQVPDYLRDLKGAKNEDNFGAGDITLPRIKLLQGLSQEPQDFNEAKAGNFWHTGMDFSLGSEFSFVIVSRRKKYLLVAPLEDGQGILARAEDFFVDKTTGPGGDYRWSPPKGEWSIKIKGVKNPVKWAITAPTLSASGLDKWGTYNPDDENSPPAATLFYEYLVLLPEHLEVGPVIILLTRSQIKKARKGLNDKIQMQDSAGRPMQSLVFKARVVKEEGQEGSFFNWQFVSDGFVQDEALYNKARELKDVLRNYKVQGEESEATRNEEGPAKVNPEDY